MSEDIFIFCLISLGLIIIILLIFSCMRISGECSKEEEKHGTSKSE